MALAEPLVGSCPYWVHAPTAYVWIVRAVAGLLVLNMIVDTLSSVPQVTLQGENLGYKRMGMSVVLVLVGGGFTWLALSLKAGIVGVAVAVVASTFATGLFYLWVVRTYTPWFGVAKPQLADTRQMLGLSWWFMGWNLVTSLLLASDVVVLGLLNSVESVTNYSLTKYVPETLIGVIVIIVFGIMPGLGSIIGTGDYEKAVRLRDEINSFIWLVATTFGASILIWNRVFIGLWVGADHYSGSIPQPVDCCGRDAACSHPKRRQHHRPDLAHQPKSSSGASLCNGIHRGREHHGRLLQAGCCGIVSWHHGWTVNYQHWLSHVDQPLPERFIIFSIKSYASTSPRYDPAFFSSQLGWIDLSRLRSGQELKAGLIFILSAGVTGILMLLLSFYAGLSDDQRKNMIRRVRAVITTAESS